MATDLTENQLFTKQRPFNFSSWLYLRFPWDLDNLPQEVTDSDLYNPDVPELIFTGDKDARENKKSYAEEYSGEFCARCGKDLKISPWANIGCFGLCHKCHDEIEQEISHKKHPWDMKPEPMFVQLDNPFVK